MDEKNPDTDFHMDCAQCGGAMELADDGMALECPYCGNREPLDQATLARLRDIDDKEVAVEEARARAAMEADRAKWERQDQKTRRRHRAIAMAIAVLVLLSLVPAACSAVEDAVYDREHQRKMSQEYSWPESGIAQKIPQPKATTGQITSNYSDYFSIEVPATSDDFNSYVEACKQRGFNVDATTSSSSFYAYNSEGYKVTVYGWSFSETMEVSIDAPRQFSSISWPPTGIGALLPNPPSLKASIESESADDFRAYFGDVSAEEFSRYANACIEAGFGTDYNKTGSYFYGENDDGVRVHLEYEGFSTMSVSVYRKDY